MANILRGTASATGVAEAAIVPADIGHIESSNGNERAIPAPRRK